MKWFLSDSWPFWKDFSKLILKQFAVICEPFWNNCRLILSDLRTILKWFSYDSPWFLNHCEVILEWLANHSEMIIERFPVIRKAFWFSSDSQWFAKHSEMSENHFIMVWQLPRIARKLLWFVLTVRIPIIFPLGQNYRRRSHSCPCRQQSCQSCKKIRQYMSQAVNWKPFLFFLGWNLFNLFIFLKNLSFFLSFLWKTFFQDFCGKCINFWGFFYG